MQREVFDILMTPPIWSENEEWARYKNRVKFGGRETQRAAADSALPLHRKSVGLLDWNEADRIIAAYTPEQTRLWNELTRPFRDPSFWDEYVTDEKDVGAEESLQEEDVAALMGDGLLREVGHDEPRQFARTFTVVETTKNRRRWILWPAQFNKRSRKWKSARGVRVDFPSMELLRSALGESHARCFDFAAFFHQFAIHPLCALYFCVRIGGRCFAPTTIPTGAMQPPLFAQLLMNAICAALTTADIKAKGFIDNIRITARSIANIDTATGVMHHLLAKLKITVNEGCDESPRYTFLGVAYDHDKKTVSVAEKTITKLRLAAPTVNKGYVTRGAILSLFGMSVWASTVLCIPRAHLYYVYKFMRRKSSGHLDDQLKIWPSIVHTWTVWIENLLLNSPSVWRDLSTEKNVYTIVTDSSMSGWGAQCYDSIGSVPERFVGARWDDACKEDFERRTASHNQSAHGPWGRMDERHINMKELCTVRKAIEHLQINDCAIDLYMDSTSALGVMRRMDSPRYLYNREIVRLLHALSSKRIVVRTTTYVNTLFNTADGISRINYTQGVFQHCN
jgi:hypothetical protein